MNLYSANSYDDSEKDDTSSEIQVLNSIWDDSHIKSYSDSWSCLWCEQTFNGKNATRALSHVIGKALYPENKSLGIGFCTAIIDQSNANLYRQLASKLVNKRESKREKSAQYNQMLNTRIVNVAKTVPFKKQKTAHDVKIAPLFLNTPSPPWSDVTEEADKSSVGSKPLLQTVFSNKTGTLHTPDKEAHLDIAIGDMIACCGLSFSLVEDPRFINMLKLARYASVHYKPPGRKKVSTTLLRMNYDMYLQETMEKLSSEAKHFGLSIMGDGATVARKPLLNTLFNGVYMPVFVANIKDCSKSLAEGETKNAEYIAGVCIQLMKDLNHKGHLFDLAFFDGAKNVQKAGKCLECIYPRMSTIHGCEHVIALFCGDLAKMPKIKRVLTTYMKLYNVFGSGCRHMPSSIFCDYAQRCNPTKQRICLLRASGTRMGGHFYSLHRLLRLHDAMRQTVVSLEWKKDVSFGQNKKLKQNIKAIVEDKKFVLAVKTLLVLMFPVIRCLRLADSNKPGMDKIWYFVRVTSNRIENFVSKLNNVFDDYEYLYHDDLDEECHFKDEIGDTEDEDSDNETEFIGTHILEKWNNRKMSLKSDFAIAGWLMCICPIIFSDAKDYTDEDEQCLERVAAKLLSHVGKPSLAVNNCMEQFQNFRNKTQYYCHNNIMWQSQLAHDGISHLWHRQYSISKCSEFAYVACRVTSKLLGIGSCERQWGDVKQMKSDKRSSLGPSATEMQSTLFGAACIEKAHMMADASSVHNWGPEDLEDDDFNRELEAFASTTENFMNQPKKKHELSVKEQLFDADIEPTTVFRAYIEEWENEAVVKKDGTYMFKLLGKYGNMRYIYPEQKTPEGYTICTHKMKWIEPENGKKKRKNGLNTTVENYLGWACILIPKGEEYVDDELDNYEVQFITANEDLHTCIAICDQDIKTTSKLWITKVK